MFKLANNAICIVGLILTLQLRVIGAMLDDFSHSDFVIESVSGLESQVFTASYPSDFGTVTAQYSVLAARARMSAGTLSFEAFSYGTGGVTYTFAAPVSLAAFSFIDLPFQHPYEYNPINRIFLYLESGARLDITNAANTPFTPARTRFPFYLFQSAFDYRIHELARVTRIYFEFSVTGTQPPPPLISIAHAAIIEGAPISAPTLTVRPRVPAGFWMETNEPIGSQYVYRLEASSDLSNWSVKYEWQRGSNSAYRMQGSFSDSPFRRLRLFHFIE